MLQLIPLSDDTPTARFPVATVGLIVINTLIFAATAVEGIGFVSVQRYAPAPCEFFASCPDAAWVAGIGALEVPERGFLGLVAVTLTSMFLHSDLLHLAGNMLYLWIFGNNVEDVLGRFHFLGFYVTGGLAAELAHSALNFRSYVPSIGASGAVAALLGAYLFLFPSARVRVWSSYVWYLGTRKLSVGIVLGVWIGSQFLIALFGDGGIAWAAHVGGFVFGLLLAAAVGKRAESAKTALEPAT